jgi:hypothetical protein
MRKSSSQVSAMHLIMTVPSVAAMDSIYAEQSRQPGSIQHIPRRLALGACRRWSQPVERADDWTSHWSLLHIDHSPRLLMPTHKAARPHPRHRVGVRDRSRSQSVSYLPRLGSLGEHPLIDAAWGGPCPPAKEGQNAVSADYGMSKAHGHPDPDPHTDTHPMVHPCLNFAHHLSICSRCLTKTVLLHGDSA